MSKSFSIFNDTPELADLSEMIFVEGGTFIMGEDRNNKKNKFKVSSFCVGKYLVTQHLYEKVMKENPSYFKGNRRPVENVSWDDTQMFFKKLEKKCGKKYRLLNEVEWEYASRGGIYWKDNFEYSGGNNLKELGWYGFDEDSNSHEESKSVGLKLENQLGLYDMSGNLWEWCKDFFISSSSNHVYRGGGCFHAKRHCRVSVRGNLTHSISDSGLGFRIASSSPKYD